MRITLTTVALAFAAAATFAQTPAPVTAPNCAEIEVTGLQADTGTLNLASYDSSDSYFKKPVWAERVKVVGATMRIPVCNLAAGEIAVVGYQDLNDNKKMDKNPLGIPAEPYGASGTPPAFSAPTWDTTKVSWPPVADAVVKVKF
jgi:uncharacterized protein (DUF2141 family)